MSPKTALILAIGGWSITSDGVEVRFGDQVLQVDSHDNSRLDADALSDSFLF
jgi:hypothetical protein